jgi:hypothetical protein
MANAIAASPLSASSSFEILRLAASEARTLPDLEAFPELKYLIDGRSSGLGSLSRTYATLIASSFIDPMIETEGKASERPFAWLQGSDSGIDTPARSYFPSQFIRLSSCRPFPIVNATVIDARSDYVFPRLLPVEYTPLYSGIRARSGRFGGGYVSSWAYDSLSISLWSQRVSPTSASNRLDLAVPDGSKHWFSLADVAASASAAPQLALLANAGPFGRFAPRAKQIEQLFPHFRHVAVRDSGGFEHISETVVSEPVSHGDGGFLDNLALMPLLARQVRNIIVFVNTSTQHFADNRDVAALFGIVGPATDEADRQHAQVFASGRYQELIAAWTRQMENGGVMLACGKGWDVLGNAHFRVRAYDALNICFYYNFPARAWIETTGPIQTVLSDRSKYKKNGIDNFPWFSTFRQLRLNHAQINLLADLSEWSVTSESASKIIHEFFGRALATEPAQDCVAPRLIE